jgi:hypothetical protein
VTSARIAAERTRSSGYPFMADRTENRLAKGLDDRQLVWYNMAKRAAGIPPAATPCPCRPESDMTTPAPTPPDRRAAARFRPAFGAVCRIDRPHPRVGLVWDVSRTGVSLILPDPPAVGGELAGALTPATGAALPVSVTVLHARRMDTGDYVIGGRFAAPLDDAQLRPFVTPAAGEG